MFISEQKVYDPKLIISVSQLRSLAAGLQSSVAKYHWNLTVDYVNDRWDTSYKLCCIIPTVNKSIVMPLHVHMVIEKKSNRSRK